MAQPPLHAGAALDLADDGRVVADAGVEAEVPTVHMAEPDGADVVRGDPVGQQLHRGHGIVGHPERAGEDVGAASRKRAERRVGSRHAGGDLVERSVAAEPDDDVDPPSRRVLGEANCVAAAIRLDDLDVVALTQRTVHDHGVARRH